MMMEIIRQLATIKETNKVTSEQLLFWMKRIEMQRVQKALLEATKETKNIKEFNAIKKVVKKVIEHKTQKEVQGCP